MTETEKMTSEISGFFKLIGEEPLLIPKRVRVDIGTGPLQKNRKRQGGGGLAPMSDGRAEQAEGFGGRQSAVPGNGSWEIWASHDEANPYSCE